MSLNAGYHATAIRPYTPRPSSPALPLLVADSRALLRRLSIADLAFLIRLVEPSITAGRGHAWQVVLAALVGEELRRREHH